VPGLKQPWTGWHIKLNEVKHKKVVLFFTSNMLALITISITLNQTPAYNVRSWIKASASCSRSVYSTAFTADHADHTALQYSLLLPTKGWPS